MMIVIVILCAAYGATLVFAFCLCKAASRPIPKRESCQAGAQHSDPRFKAYVESIFNAQRNELVRRAK